MAIAAVGVLVVALGSGPGSSGWGVGAAASRGRRPTPPAQGDDAVVARVVDGDTIEVAGGEVVRLIGVDAPDVAGPGECYGREAQGRMNELLPAGAAIKLTYDEERTDGSGRTLAYVYRASDALFVNLALAQGGFVRESIEAPNLAHVVELATAVAEAEARRRGLWGVCGDSAPTSPTAAPRTTANR